MIPSLGGVAVLVAALNEEAQIERCLRSLRAQTNRPDLLILVDSQSEDRTVLLAKRYVDVVYTAPRGKFRALNAAIRNLPARIRIVATADADTYYPEDWLGALTAPLLNGEPGVVMTHGHRSFPHGAVVDTLVDRANKALINPAFITAAQNRAYFRDAYDACGGLNENLPTSWLPMWLEEEVGLTRRMVNLGIVRLVPEAWCVSSSRRFVHPMQAEYDPAHARGVALGQRF